MEKLKQGESYTIGFVFPDDYDLTRIELIKVYLNNDIFVHTITDNVVRCELKSDDTALLYGIIKVKLWIDDSVFGVKELSCTEVKVDESKISHNESINEGFDVLIVLAITETAITVESVLYNYFKGEPGDTYYATFHVDLETGDLIMTNDPDFTNTEFSIVNGDLILKI